MYTGTLIAQLIATVERAEAQARREGDPVELEAWYAFTSQETAVEPKLLGVA